MEKQVEMCVSMNLSDFTVNPKDKCFMLSSNNSYDGLKPADFVLIDNGGSLSNDEWNNILTHMCGKNTKIMFVSDKGMVNPPSAMMDGLTKWTNLSKTTSNL